MTAPFLPNAAYTNSRAALEGTPKRHAFFAGRGVALVAGCLGGPLGTAVGRRRVAWGLAGDGSPAGWRRAGGGSFEGPRLRLTRAWQRSYGMHDFSAAAVSRDLGFPFRLRKRPPEIVHSARSLPRRSSVRRRIDADASLPGSCGEPLERLASL